MSSSSYATSPPPGSQDPTVPQEASPTASPQQSQPQTAAAPSSTSSSATTTNDNLYLHNDPARTGFDPAQGWAANYLRILTGRVTDEGIFHYREARSRAHEARDVARAEKHRDWLLAYSPTVRFLNDRIAELNHGQAMGPHNIVCRRCPARLTTTTAGGRPLVERQGGGFDPERGILVCSNSVRNRGHLEDTLAHEMVHAYDHLRWEVDFVGRNSLRQAACAEVRLLSGFFYLVSCPMYTQKNKTKN